MQLFPIVVVAVVLTADASGPQRELTASQTLTALAVAAGPVLLLVAAAHLGVLWTRRRIAARAGLRPIMWLDRALQLARLLLLATHATAVFRFQWLNAVRGIFGDLLLVDELVAMLPPLLGVVALWCVHYPIERQLRESLLIRRLDMGRPIHRVPSRASYVMQQTRHHVLLVFVPLLCILILAESLDFLLPRVDAMLASTLDRAEPGVLPPWLGEVSTLGAALLVLLFAPLLARLVLEVESLPAGEVRADLEEICRRHRVKARNLLLWRTDGMLINAAVMGLIGPLRYVLLTDALIETLNRSQLQAVMAHEIGHVRRRHMPWLVASLLALLMAVPFLFSLPLVLAELAGVNDGSTLYEAAEITAIVLAGLLLIALFGWISRRYEQQADTFAVQHLSGLGLSRDEHPGGGRITADAVSAMLTALDAIAQINTVDRRRRSWRHGSIASRQAYLLSLVGRPLHPLPIDRIIAWMKVMAVVLLVASVSGTIALEWIASRAVASVPTPEQETG